MPRRSGRKPPPDEPPPASGAAQRCPCPLCCGTRRPLHCAACVSQGLLTAQRRLTALRQQAAARQAELDDRLASRVSALHAAERACHPGSCRLSPCRFGRLRSCRVATRHQTDLRAIAERGTRKARRRPSCDQIATVSAHGISLRGRPRGYSNRGGGRRAPPPSAGLGRLRTRRQQIWPS